MLRTGAAPEVPEKRKVDTADVQQAGVFYAFLAEQRTQLCDRLDQQAARLAHYERHGDRPGSERKRRLIRALGAEIRDIDRMMHGLRVRLLRRERDAAGRTG
jgi:hypothetical protein